MTTRPWRSQDALLPRERDVIELLVDGNLDGEGQRVAAAGHGALGTGRGLDAAAAAADVLLLLHLHDAVADLDDVDHLARLELPLHRREPAAAARTGRVGIVELEGLLDDRQRGCSVVPKRCAACGLLGSGGRVGGRSVLDSGQALADCASAPR